MQPPPDPLDALLDRWDKNAPPTSGNLEAEVWRRIAVNETAEPRLTVFQRIEAVFARPSFTVAFVAACMLLGLFLAEARVSDLQARRSVHVVQNYLRLIDPLLEAGATYPVLPATASRP